MRLARRQSLVLGVVLVALLVPLVWWLLLPAESKAALHRALMAQLLVRPNISMRSNWNREALGFGRFGVAATEEWNGDILILYDATCSDLQRHLRPVVGYEFFRPSSERWVSLGGGARSEPAGAAPLVFNTGLWQGFDQNGQPISYSLVHGRILDPAVHTIEVVFGDGTTVRESPSSAVFRVLIDRPSIACTLRPVDAQGQELTTITLWTGRAPAGAQGTC